MLGKEHVPKAFSDLLTTRVKAFQGTWYGNVIPGFLLVQPTNSRRSDSKRKNFYGERTNLDVDDLARQRHVEVENQGWAEFQLE